MPTIAKVVAQVQVDFAHLPLRRMPVTSYPGPDSLVNFDTAFYAGTAQAQLFDPILLGISVHVTATPVRWHWSWGDGSSAVTTTPGVPRQPVVTHRYTRASTVAVTVSVEWAGTFTVGGDPTAYPIAAHAFTTPRGTTVGIREARTQLVSH